jgi:hypothetical protein
MNRLKLKNFIIKVRRRAFSEKCRILRKKPAQAVASQVRPAIRKRVAKDALSEAER